jgi:hypothetical protein
MPRLITIVTVSRTKGRDTAESEVKVKTLEDLYAACRDAPPSTLVRVSLKGADGEVRLNFASFLKPGSKE